jgi:hypothetical protein
MRIKLYILVSTVALLFGCSVYCLLNTIIIIRLPSLNSTPPYASDTGHAHKKTVVLSLFKGDGIKKEQQKIVWSACTVDNYTLLINSWLTLLVDEGVTLRRISLQSVALDAAQKHLFVSFEQTLFDANDTTYRKLMMVESLLKTIKDTAEGIQTVYILVQHQPLQDPHLSFALGWPVSGFVQED